MAYQTAFKTVATRQKVRLGILFFILLTFPITLNYFSPVLIMESAAAGVMNFSFFFWIAFVALSLYLGRAFCGYGCPLGAFQETKDRMVPKSHVRINNLRWLKYVLSAGWVGAIAALAIIGGGYTRINLLYNTESGVSIDRAEGWFIYGFIAILVLLPAFFMGKRGFCHYFCPWGVLNIFGTRIKNFFRWPSLHLRTTTEKCQRCHTCDRNCPMNLEVSRAVQRGFMVNDECILCGTCVDNCPNSVIKYSWGRPPR
jgi:ferredoxin-type protein NapH